MNPELESRLIDARQQVDALIRDLRSGAARPQVLLGLLRHVSELHSYLLEQAAERVASR